MFYFKSFSRKRWIPAYAGMTESYRDDEKPCKISSRHTREGGYPEKISYKVPFSTACSHFTILSTTLMK